MAWVTERNVVGMVREAEAVVEGVLRCAWMTEEDVRMVRTVMATQAALLAGEVVDVGGMAGCLLGLAVRAEAVGALRWMEVFDQWYAWTCALMAGKAVHWSAWPWGEGCGEWVVRRSWEHAFPERLTVLW